MKPDPKRPDKRIDPATDIWPISDWGYEVARGFVRDARFSRTDCVIPGTNRTAQKKWRQAEMKREKP